MTDPTNLLNEEKDLTAQLFWQLVGPLFVLTTFALMPKNPLLFVMGTLGLFLSAKFRMKGFLASVSVLFFGAILNAFTGTLRFPWMLGIESSFGLAFFITAQTTEFATASFESIKLLAERKAKAILNLEDEIEKSKSEMFEKHLRDEEKLAKLQKQLDEVLSEQSSLNVLNEVLRKTTAKHIAEVDLLNESLTNERIALDFERKEKEAHEKTIERLKSEHAIISQNKELIDEINAVRLEKEQTHAINETLARLHAKESLRAKDALEQLDLYEKERGVKESEEIANLKTQVSLLEQELLDARHEKETLHADAKEVADLKKKASMLEKDLLEARSEKESLEKSLENQKGLEAENRDSSALQELVSSLQKKVKELSSADAKYKQLKQQFQEKSEVLHKARQELFKVDSAFQTLQREVDLDSRMDSKEVLDALTSLERLEEENRELQELVTRLSQVP